MEVAYNFDQEFVVVVPNEIHASVVSPVKNSRSQVESSYVKWTCVKKHALEAPRQ
jgi:hypothetical protein